MADIAGNVAGNITHETARDVSGICESQVTGGVQGWEGSAPPETGTAVRGTPALVRTTP